MDKRFLFLTFNIFKKKSKILNSPDIGESKILKLSTFFWLNFNSLFYLVSNKSNKNQFSRD